MWKQAAVGVLLALSAVAVSTARPGLRSPASFAQCDVVAGGQPTTAPDGTLVYTYGYYVHSIRPDGSHDRKLFSSDEPVSFPSVSPDGRLIAFAKGEASHEVWVMNSDGSGAHYVASGTSPEFSPDGTQLAIGGAPTGNNRADLDVIGIDGLGRRTLAIDALPNPEPAWSRDGTKIVFDSYVTGPYTIGPMMKVVDAGGTNERDFAGGGSASWSPDGSAVAYTQPAFEAGNALWLINADGTGGHSVTPFSLHFDSLSPTWSADGRKLTYFVTPTQYPTTADGLLWQVDATGRGRHPLAPDCRFGTGGADRIHGTARRDTIYALEGNDRIDVRGGGRDFVDCGLGRDVVRADRRDVIARNCERRLR
jgi:RTX calcium-binding nonapeptide repeat (4 copies)/WD40-like Beta Propeller Repeat